MTLWVKFESIDDTVIRTFFRIVLANRDINLTLRRKMHRNFQVPICVGVMECEKFVDVFFRTHKLSQFRGEILILIKHSEYKIVG